MFFRIFVIACYFLVLSSGVAQDFEHYQPARCSGEIPEEFLKLSSDKAIEAVKAVKEKDLTRMERRDERNYAISANFLLDDLLSSGQILYGDSMTVFINELADVLLRNYPDLRTQLRFYVYRSVVPNAYATHTGVVLISTGLLARVENEAQIASILAHEIQHFIKKHSLQQYKKVKEMQRSNISRVSIDERLREFYRFSKESESEADELGFKLMKESGYNLHQGIEVFDMLRYTEYPFLETSMSFDSFETGYFVFPNVLREDIAKILSAAETRSRIASKEGDGDDDDENSTHPSLTKRINRLRDMLDEEGIEDNHVNFLISETRFHKMQRQARSELLILYMRSASFGKVVYLSRIMELVYGRTDFTDRTAAMGWYGIASHRLMNHSLSEYGCNTRLSVGDWLPFFAMIEAMNSKELTTLSIRELYRYKTMHPGDAWFTDLCNRVCILAQREGDIRLGDYFEWQPEKPADTVAVTPGTPSPVKNPKDRAKAVRSSTGSKLKWYHSAFYHLENLDELKAYFTSVEYNLSTSDKEVPDKRSKKKKIKNPAVVVPTLAIFQPTFNQYDISTSGKQKKNFFDDESMVFRLGGKLQELGTTAGMPVTLVSATQKANLTTSDMNRYMILNDWFMERMNNDTNAMVLWNNQYTKEVLDELGTNHIGWVGFHYVVSKRAFDLATCFYSMIFYPTFPFYLVWQLSRERELKYLAVVFDTRTGSLTSLHNETISHKLTGDFLNAQIYKLLYNIKYQQ